MSQTIERPRIGGPGSGLGGAWRVIVLNDDPIGIQRLPDKFNDFIAGKEPAALQLREAGCGFCRWPVDVLFDGRGKMYLHKG